MTDIQNIFYFYDCYFKKFVIAPEADSISMNRFWVECQHRYVNTKEFVGKNAPQIYFTTVSVPQNKSSKEQIFENVNSKRSKEGLAKFERGKLLSRKRKHYPEDAEDIDLCRKPVVNNIDFDCRQYRIGFNLGIKKRQIYAQFIINEYNALNTYCSSEIFGETLLDNISIPTFVAENLSNLRRKPCGKITGKKKINGEYITDDVADAVIMSIMLFPLAVGETPNMTPLCELKPEMNKDGSIGEIQNQQYTITAVQKK